MSHSGSVTILMYHSVREPGDGRVDPSIVVTPSNFEWQVSYLARHTSVIALEQFICSVRDRIPIPRNSTIITFDDGYKDNFTCAYPILKKYGMPATFFLATDYIGTGRVKWENRLSYLISRSTVREGVVNWPTLPQGRRTFRIASPGEKAEAIYDLVRLLSDAPQDEREAVLDHIQREFGVDSYDMDPDAMLSWDDVRAMDATPGISFGSHSASHPRLSALSENDLQREIGGSKQQIEAEIGKEVAFFSYPSGSPADYDERVKAILKANGFACAATTVYGQNDARSDLFELKRVMAPNSQGIRFGLGLRTRRSPIGEPLKRALILWKRLT